MTDEKSARRLQKSIGPQEVGGGIDMENIAVGESCIRQTKWERGVVTGRRDPAARDFHW